MPLNTVDNDGRTPLLWAAEKGHAGIVLMLLERGDATRPTPKTVDKGGRTPLSWAAVNEGMKATPRCSWNARISLPALRIKAVQCLSRGLRNMGT